MVWKPWKPLKPSVLMSSEALHETLDEGQAFRWWDLGDGVWEGVWLKYHVRVRSGKGSLLEYSLSEDSDDTKKALIKYFCADMDYDALMDALPWRSDVKLNEAIGYYRGMRILKQPLSEMLITFICSSTKRIVQIKEMLELLADRYGGKLHSGRNALPDWEAISELGEQELRGCKLGYRAKYLCGVAEVLKDEPAYFERIEALDYEEAHAELIKLPGIGHKVADCALLFGAAKLESFPVDTWIIKAMSGLYGLKGWKPKQIAQFGRAHFGASAGLAQQYLFSAVRRGKIKV